MRALVALGLSFVAVAALIIGFDLDPKSWRDMLPLIPVAMVISGICETI